MSTSRKPAQETWSYALGQAMTWLLLLPVLAPIVFVWSSVTTLLTSRRPTDGQ